MDPHLTAKDVPTPRATSLNSVADSLAELIGRVVFAIDAVENRSGEILANLRVRTEDVRTEASQALEHLHSIAQQAQGLQQSHQTLFKQIERQWPEHLDKAAAAAGAAQAQTFGESIAAGIQSTLVDATRAAIQAAQQMERASDQLHWKTVSVAIISVLGFAFIVALCLWGWELTVRSDVEALRSERATLEQTIDKLKQSGGELDVARCATDDERLCVRIDPNDRFGPRKDYAPVKYKGS